MGSNSLFPFVTGYTPKRKKKHYELHGGAGVSSDTVLALLWVTARTLQIADGPNEVHLGTIGKLELQRARLWRFWTLK